ncbi:MAG: hypothetical protein HYY16_14995 [Planctomycetes bacterium]|nr:hypothetical protein [Planctomycetota bacterium]
MRRAAIVFGLLALPGVVFGGETRTWEVAKRDAFARGEEFEKLILTSRGELRLGYASEVVEMKDEPSLWSAVLLEDGSCLAGTGKGSIYRIAAGKAEKVWETKEMLVTSLIVSGGDVYAATIPNGKIFRRDGASWKEFATVPSKYVWQLLAGPQGELVAACGSPGAVYRVDSAGKPRAVFAPGKESALKCENVLCVSADGEALVVGTSAPGYFLRIEKDKAHVLVDFGDGEVKSIAAHGEGWHVAVNSGAKATPSEFLNAVEQAVQKKEDVQPKEPQGGQAKPEGAAIPGPAPAGQGAGAAQGSVWRVSGARTERVVEFPTSYITELAATDRGVYVGTSNSGRVFRLSADGEHELLFDFPEGQVLGFVRSGRAVRGALMGSRAALRTFTEEQADKGVYVSEVLDTRFPTNWGNLTWRGSGGFTVETRSGNIAKAGEGWSDWSAPISSSPGKVSSPKGRYLQFRITVTDPAAVVRGVSVAYKNENQRPRVRDLKVEVLPSRQDGMVPMSGERGPSPRLGEGHSLIKRLQWRGEDDDGDYVVYRIYVKPVDGGTWLPLLGNDSTPMFEYAWNTENVPDGRYVLRVVASDEKANPKEEALTGEAETDAILIDNGKPEIEATIAGSRVSGVTSDRASNVTRIEYNVDGGEWHAAPAKDRIFDDRREEFDFELQAVAPGAHTLTMRALDQESNVGTLSKTFEVRP